MKDLLNDLRYLTAHRQRPSLSLYLPLRQSHGDERQAPLRLKNLLRQARALLPEPDAEELLAPIESELSEPALAEPGACSLAVFASRSHRARYALPVGVSPRVVVEDRFHLKPLIGLLGTPARFRVLAISRNHTRLIEADHWSTRRLPSADDLLPASLEATLPEREGEPQLQLHSGPRGSALYHGQGAGEHRRDHDLHRYLERIHDGLREVLGDDESPVVLAGVRELAAAFRTVAGDARVLDEGVEGNPDHLSDDELAERARPLARKRLDRRRASARSRIRKLAHTPRITSRLEDIVFAALDGRVEALFVDDRDPAWGQYDASRRRVRIEPRPSGENEDLLDLAAAQTFEQGGEVFVVDGSQMPLPNAAATAMLRY
jgi:hypothetical protein